jgi:hypothetical protein
MTSFTPQAGAASLITTGGTPVNAVLAVPIGIGGGFIMNPFTAADQGLGAAEPLYINPVANATLQGNGTTVALQPGQTWVIPAGQNTPTSVNATSNGHKFTVVWWLPPA